MGYIQEMRALVGHRPILLVGAAVLMTNREGHLLLGLRSDNHTWGVPGGAMEPGENLEEAACREAQEETGRTPDALRLFGVFSGPELFYTYPNGDQVYNVTVVYECSDFHDSGLAVDDEHSGFRFFPPDRLPQPLSPPIRTIIQAWLDRQNGNSPDSGIQYHPIS